MQTKERAEPPRVTLKMIAIAAGTSVGTVDRALNNRDGVKEESKRRILQVAAALGYRPNMVARALGRRRAVRIGVICPEGPAEFYAAIYQGIAAAEEEMRDFGVVVEMLLCKNQDPEVMRERLVRVDPAQYDGLAVNLSGAASIAQINRFVKAGTPVVTFNTDFPDSGRLFYVGNDSCRSGMVGGELLRLLLGGEGNVTVLGNFVRATPFIERFGGFCEYIQRHAPNLRVYPCSECLSEPDLAAKSLVDLLTRVPDIGGVFCTGYSSTVGAARALEMLGRRDIKMVGYDVTETTAAALHAGWCCALLYQDPYRQAYRAVQLLARHILEGWLPPDPKLHVDTQIVLSCNVDSYLSSQSEPRGVKLEM